MTLYILSMDLRLARTLPRQKTSWTDVRTDVSEGRRTDSPTIRFPYDKASSSATGRRIESEKKEDRAMKIKSHRKRE